MAARRLNQLPNVRCEAGEAWTWDDVEFRVLHPTAGSYLDPRLKSNDRSCVIKVSSAHGSLLLTGDIEARSEAELILREGDRLTSTLMLVPHHGSKTSSTDAFLDAVDPDLAIATPGYRNRFGHPRPEVLARYESRSVRLLRSDYDGAIEARFDGGPPSMRTWRSDKGPYWRDRPVRDRPPLE